MCSSVAAKLWFLTDRRIREDYPQKEILRALKAKCCEEELDFRAVVMDEVVLTIEQGNLGKSLSNFVDFTWNMVTLHVSGIITTEAYLRAFAY